MGLIYKEIKIAAEGELPEKFSYSSEKSLHIVLIVHEALNNAVKHSQAKNIGVGSIIEKETWIIEVKDDGNGITKNAPTSDRGGNGLNNMKERALMAGISLTIDSETSKGTMIT